MLLMSSKSRAWPGLIVLASALAAAGVPIGHDSAVADGTTRPSGSICPMFGGTPSRNMVNTQDKNIPSEWDVKSGKNIKWRARLGSRAYGGPVIAQGKILVGTNNEAPRDPSIKGDRGVVMCFDTNGQFLWQMVHNKLEAGMVNDWPREGICSTPTIEGNRVYYVSNRCEVLCVSLNPLPDKKEPTVHWKLDMIKQLGVFPHNMAAGCPLILNDLVYTVTANGVDEDHINLPAPDAPSFLGIDKNTGKVAWRDNSPGKNVMHGQWSNATLIEVDGKPQIIFPGGDGWLRGFDPKGEQLWRFDANPKDSKYLLGGRGTRSDFIGTPVAYDGKIYIGTGQDPEHGEGIGHLWCIDPAGKRGDISPDLVTDAAANPPKTKPNPKSAVVWHHGGPDRSPNAKRDFVFGRTMSTCAIHEGLLYAAEYGGYLHCLDVKTGKPHWIHDVKSAVWGSPYVVDGKVFLATEDGDVWIFEHGREKKEPRTINMEQPIRSTPVVADGVLYVMTESELVAIAVK